VVGYVMRQFTCPKAVIHPSTNRARCRTTALIETNALPLHQTAREWGRREWITAVTVPQLSHGHQKEHVKSEDRRPRGGEQWKKKENNLDGYHGAKPERKHRTEAIGINHHHWQARRREVKVRVYICEIRRLHLLIVDLLFCCDSVSRYFKLDYT